MLCARLRRFLQTALSYAVLLLCCRPAGAVVHADIVSNPDGTSKGWGVVAFATPSDADAAIQVWSVAHCSALRLSPLVLLR